MNSSLYALLVACLAAASIAQEAPFFNILQKPEARCPSSDMVWMDCGPSDKHNCYEVTNGNLLFSIKNVFGRREMCSPSGCYCRPGFYMLPNGQCVRALECFKALGKLSPRNLMP